MQVHFRKIYLTGTEQQFPKWGMHMLEAIQGQPQGMRRKYKSVCVVFFFFVCVHRHVLVCVYNPI